MTLRLWQAVAMMLAGSSIAVRLMVRVLRFTYRRAALRTALVVNSLPICLLRLWTLITCVHRLMGLLIKVRWCLNVACALLSTM